MKNLITVLKEETKSLESQYMQMTEKWAAAEYERLRDWAQDYHNGRFGFSGASKTYSRLPYCVVNSNGTAKQYIDLMLKQAAFHYETSIQKLAARIEKKGLNQENLKTVTSHIGVNIETTLTDGNKTVRAFTIIAEGEIQRPHYRYLIK